MKREKSEAALSKAEEAWKKAPSHVKVMAGEYVNPLLEAIEALNNEMADLKNDLIKGVV